MQRAAPAPFAAHTPHTPQAADEAIVSVEIAVAGSRLAVSFASGRVATIPADLLWRRCPSSAGRRRRLHGGNLAPPDLAITKLNAIGHYAVNIGFSDGHDRGIYPWRLLLELSRQRTPADFIIAS